MLADSVVSGRATDGPSPPWPGSPEPPNLRPDFFNTVWCQDTFDATKYKVEAADVVGALVLAGIVPPDPITVAYINNAILSLPSVPPQPQMWYSNDWPLKKRTLMIHAVIGGKCIMRIFVGGTGVSAKR